MIREPGDLPSTTTNPDCPAGVPGKEPILTTDQSVLESKSEADDIEACAAMTIVVCHSCRLPDNPLLDPRPGSDFAVAVLAAAENTGITVKKAGCLANCKRGLSAAVLRDGCWSYVFGELTPENAEDLIAGAQLFATSTDGFMPFRARPESLKRGLIARIPTFDNLKDLP
jgi:predicted metal-binding protein